MTWCASRPACASGHQTLGTGLVHRLFLEIFRRSLCVHRTFHPWRVAQIIYQELDQVQLDYFAVTQHLLTPKRGPFSALKDVVSPQNNQVVPDPILDKLFAQLVTGETFDERKETFGKFQERVYEQVLFLKFGDLMRKQACLRIRSPNFRNRTCS